MTATGELPAGRRSGPPVIREDGARPRSALTHLVDVGRPVGLYLDCRPDFLPPAPGDWITTRAGSRYLVFHVHQVKRRNPTRLLRYQLRCFRLPKHTAAPADVRAIELDWYRRSKGDHGHDRG